MDHLKLLNKIFVSVSMCMYVGTKNTQLRFLKEQSLYI